MWSLYTCGGRRRQRAARKRNVSQPRAWLPLSNLTATRAGEPLHGRGVSCGGGAAVCGVPRGGRDAPVCALPRENKCAGGSRVGKRRSLAEHELAIVFVLQMHRVALAAKHRAAHAHYLATARRAEARASRQHAAAAQDEAPAANGLGVRASECLPRQQRPSGPACHSPQSAKGTNFGPLRFPSLALCPPPPSSGRLSRWARTTS